MEMKVCSTRFAGYYGFSWDFLLSIGFRDAGKGGLQSVCSWAAKIAMSKFAGRVGGFV